MTWFAGRREFLTACAVGPDARGLYSFTGDLVNFSSPTDGGSLSANVVPEPAAVGLFAGGLLALLLVPLRLLRKR